MQMDTDNEPFNPLKDMNLMDDFLFDVATVDLETCKIIIELSLGITLTKIAWKEGQKVVHNLPGKRRGSVESGWISMLKMIKGASLM